MTGYKPSNAPLPLKWTRNTGADRRPLQLDMDVRTFDGREWIVVSANSSGATIQLRGGSLRLQISTHSEVWYRKAVVDVDDPCYDVLDSVIDDDVDDEGGDMKKGREKVTKAGGISGPPVRKPVNKGKTATKKKNADNPVHQCVCGCGKPTRSFFFPSHDSTFKKWLRQHAAGNPNDMPAAVFEALGPWKDIKGGGRTPAKTYRDIPRVAVAG